jgi:beta propeller repeat protein
MIVLAFLFALSGVIPVQSIEGEYAHGTSVSLNPQFQSGDPAITFHYIYSDDFVIFQNLQNTDEIRYPLGLYLHRISENRTLLIPGTQDDEYGADILGTKTQGDRILWRHMFFENVFYIYNSTTGTERIVPDSSAWGVLKTYHRQFGNITIDQFERADPAIDGDRLVWEQGFSTATNEPETDLYMMNPTGEVIAISESPGRQERPSISGRYIVWEDTRAGVENPDIYLYDLETGKESPICTDISYQRYPVVSGDYVIWIDLRNGFDFSQIRMYRISTGTETVISKDIMMRHEAPFISGDRVVFLKCIPYSVNPRGICQGVVYDIRTNEYMSLPETRDSQYLWGFSGDRILYSEETDSDRQIYLFTLENRTPTLPSLTSPGVYLNESGALPAKTPPGESHPTESPGFNLLSCSIAISVIGLPVLLRRRSR